ECVLIDARAAGPGNRSEGLHEGGVGLVAFAHAIATYLGFGVGKKADYSSPIVLWSSTRGHAKSTFSGQALPMQWDFSEVNVFAEAAGDFSVSIAGISRTLGDLPTASKGAISDIDASANSLPIRPVLISTDPPYYDNIGYADLSDYFYVWQRRMLA